MGIGDFLKQIRESFIMYSNKIGERMPFYEEAYCKPCKETALKNTLGYPPCMTTNYPLSTVQLIICAKTQRKIIEMENDRILEEGVFNYLDPEPISIENQ